jgi:hypothetical protein
VVCHGLDASLVEPRDSFTGRANGIGPKEIYEKVNAQSIRLSI